MQTTPIPENMLSYEGFFCRKETLFNQKIQYERKGFIRGISTFKAACFCVVS